MHLIRSLASHSVISAFRCISVYSWTHTIACGTDGDFRLSSCSNEGVIIIVRFVASLATSALSEPTLKCTDLHCFQVHQQSKATQNCFEFKLFRSAAKPKFANHDVDKQSVVFLDGHTWRRLCGVTRQLNCVSLYLSRGND